ncbi:MAG: hypothetical protein M3033_01095 [Acidobacteriota bacterium]|nr:hypothetical protein [Acidobacteriota bacterium]
MKRLHLLLTFCLWFSAADLFAQTTSKKPIKQCDAMLARQIIEEQADFSKTIDETDKRANVLVKVADFLWTSDEEAARRYFAEAFQVAQDRYHEKGLEKIDAGKGLIHYKPDYRFMVVEAVAKRDPQWAKKLSETILKEFDEDKDKDNRDDFDKNRETQQLLGIAAQVAKDNPELALSLARRIMRYPLTNAWYFMLYQMAGNNQTLADSIYTELLTNYANAEVYRLLYLSAYPFSRERIFGLEKYSLGTSIPANFSPNQNLKRQFLLVLFNRIQQLTSENTTKSLQTSTPESAVAVIALNELEPVVMQQFPDLMPMFSQVKLQANSVVSNEIMDSANKRNEQGENWNKSFAEKLKDVEKADADGKLNDYLIYELATAAKKEEDFKAAESWLDKMQEEQARDGVINYFYFQRSRVAAKDKRFEDARKYAEKVVKIEHRAVLYFDIAEAKLNQPNAKYEALDTLLEVYQLAQKAPDSVEKAQVLMGVANVYEKINHSNAIDALAAAIKTANALSNPDLFSSSQTQQIVGKKFAFFASYDVPGFDLNKTFYEISRADFQGALIQAESFNDRYLRTLAVMATVRDCEKNIKKEVKEKAATPVKVKPKQ